MNITGCSFQVKESLEESFCTSNGDWLLNDVKYSVVWRRYEAAEGSASTSPPLAETPPYLRWAENLHFLLADPDGVELFEKFLEQENCSHLLKVRYQ